MGGASSSEKWTWCDEEDGDVTKIPCLELGLHNHEFMWRGEQDPRMLYNHFWHMVYEIALTWGRDSRVGGGGRGIRKGMGWYEL